jgi:CRISPR-associated endonuclease/helicase Cas3
MAQCAVELANDGGRRVIIFANSRKTAQAVAAQIEKAAKKAPALLVGARRVHERERLEDNEIFKRFSPEAGPTRGPAFLVATSAGEVGVDLDADALVCDLAPWERMVQRLGRVNRRAEPGEARIVVFDASDDDGEDAVENETKARGAAIQVRETTSAALRELLSSGKWPKGEDGAHDASPLALLRLKRAAADDPDLRSLLERATTPAPLRPALTRAVLDAWSMTTLETHTGRPIVEPWLRGWVEREPQARVLWRRHLPRMNSVDAKGTLARLDAFFEAAPPHLTEILETYAAEIAEVAKGRAEASFVRMSAGIDDGDAVAVILDASGAARRFLTAKELCDKTPVVRDLAGQTLVLDARLGGLDANGLLDAKADIPPPTLDEGGKDWRPDAETIGFRVRIAERGAGSDRNWRVAFRQPLGVEDEDADGEELRVEVFRGRSEGVGDLAIARKAQTLAQHTEDIVAEVESIADGLGLVPELRAALVASARLHDLGKARDEWQRAMGAAAGSVYAKTLGGGNPRLLTIGDESYRHEFGSLRDAAHDRELNALPPDLRDLALHLIVAHHGFGRPTIAALDFDEPPSLVESRAGEVALRFICMQRRWGWWGLAWLESLLRAADWAASAKNDAREDVHG